MMSATVTTIMMGARNITSPDVWDVPFQVTTHAHATRWTTNQKVN